MNSELIEKINFIFKCFYEKDLHYWKGIKKNDKYFQNPMIWNMDTDLLNTIKRLKKNISKFENVNYIEIIKTNQINKKGNPLYFIEFNNENITPNKKNPQYVATSTIRQYCQFLTCLDIIKFDNFQKQGFKLECSNFKDIIENFDSMAFSIIFNGQKSAISWVRNLGYSLFLSVLFYKRFDFDLIDQNYKIIEKKKRNKKTGEKILYIKNSKKEIEKMFKETYKELVINNFPNKSLDEIIDCIYNDILSYSYEQETLELLKNKKILDEQKYHRSIFKKNILNNRQEKKLIETENDLYSDLMQDIGINEDLIAKWKDLHACHIYEVKNIRKDFELSKYISDPNNGLMMKSEYHWAFDKGLFGFNENGEMWYRKEEENYLFNELKLKRCKIREEIFNFEMITFLKKRS